MHTCRICDHTTSHATYMASEKMYGLGDEFEYFQCALCGCLQIAEIPEDLGKYYPDNYYSYRRNPEKTFAGLSGSIRKLRLRSTLFRKGLLQRAVNAIYPARHLDSILHLDLKLDTRILDVGCGSGARFLYALREAGYANTMGCEPFLDTELEYSNGLVIKKSVISQMTGEWDLITFHHSFEHLPAPLEDLSATAEHLAPDGICLIRIPISSSWAFEHYGTNWVQLDAPRHLYLHSRRSLELLAENCGLEVFDVIYDSTAYQITGSERYVRKEALRSDRKRGPLESLKRRRDRKKYAKQAETLNANEQGDQACFYLRHQR